MAEHHFGARLRFLHSTFQAPSSRTTSLPFLSHPHHLSSSMCSKDPTPPFNPSVCLSVRDSLGCSLSLSLSLPFSPTPSPWLLQLQSFFQASPRPKTNLNPRLCLAILFTGASDLSQNGPSAEPNTPNQMRPSQLVN